MLVFRVEFGGLLKENASVEVLEDIIFEPVAMLLLLLFESGKPKMEEIENELDIWAASSLLSEFNVSGFEIDGLWNALLILFCEKSKTLRLEAMLVDVVTSLSRRGNVSNLFDNLIKSVTALDTIELFWWYFNKTRAHLMCSKSRFVSEVAFLCFTNSKNAHHKSFEIISDIFPAPLMTIRDWGAEVLTLIAVLMLISSLWLKNSESRAWLRKVRSGDVIETVVWNWNRITSNVQQLGTSSTNVIK